MGTRFAFGHCIALYFDRTNECGRKNDEDEKQKNDSKRKEKEDVEKQACMQNALLRFSFLFVFVV